jgi:hypothetical protein
VGYLSNNTEKENMRNKLTDRAIDKHTYLKREEREVGGQRQSEKQKPSSEQKHPPSSLN